MDKAELRGWSISDIDRQIEFLVHQNINDYRVPEADEGSKMTAYIWFGFQAFVTFMSFVIMSKYVVLSRGTSFWFGLKTFSS